ncbi:MAG: class I tRNA ligase family protein [Nanoarchaeota archaeon]
MAKQKLNFKEIEEKWRNFWEKEKIYKFNPNSQKKIFSVDIPPPTISGSLHMGHAFGDAQQDFFVRYKRMKGFEILAPFGTDDNGLPTLRLIEKLKKIDSRKMKKQDFIKLCLKTVKEELIPQFLEDEKRLGASNDWDLFYSTIDKNSQKIAQWSFLDLYKKGRAYRTHSPALWCTECKTTIAQVELEDKKEQSVFYDIEGFYRRSGWSNDGLYFWGPRRC